MQPPAAIAGNDARGLPGIAAFAYNAAKIRNRSLLMASITIRNLDAHTRGRLRVRAAQRQVSMEEEAHRILRAALAKDDAAPHDLAAAIHARFKPLGGIDLALPARGPVNTPSDADKAAG